MDSGATARRRDLDYMVQTNFLSFLILWKVERFEQSKKYIEMCKKFIGDIINNGQDLTDYRADQSIENT